jgi:hypothetical protein
MLLLSPSFSALQLPDELANRAGLGPKRPDGRLVHLADFVEAIPEILNHMPDTVLREHLAEVHEFYAKADVAMSTIEREKRAFRGDIVMLYRTRNKIVHSASFGDTSLLHFIRSAEELSKLLISNFLSQYLQKGNRTLEGIISGLFSEYDLLLEKVKHHGAKAALFRSE